MAGRKVAMLALAAASVVACGSVARFPVAAGTGPHPVLPAPVIDVLAGFITEEGDALGRPVGVALDRTGALLVAGDVGNVIWRVSATARQPRRNP